LWEPAEVVISFRPEADTSSPVCRPPRLVVRLPSIQVDNATGRDVSASGLGLVATIPASSVGPCGYFGTLANYLPSPDAEVRQA